MPPPFAGFARQTEGKSDCSLRIAFCSATRAGYLSGKGKNWRCFGRSQSRPLLAQSRHRRVTGACPELGVKRHASDIADVRQ